MTPREDLILICSCSHLSHAARFTYDAEDDIVYLSVSLVRDRGFWRRLVTAWRYLFGNVCGFGDVSEMLLKPEDVGHLTIWLDAVGPARPAPIRWGLFEPRNDAVRGCASWISKSNPRLVTTDKADALTFDSFDEANDYRRSGHANDWIRDTFFVTQIAPEPAEVVAGSTTAPVEASR